jgi:ketosteroid isomerase-like protein
MSALSYDERDGPAQVSEAVALEIGWCWARAFNRRDADALVEIADPKVVIYPTRLLVQHGPYVGHDGLRRWVAELLDKDFPLSEEVTEVRAGLAGNLVALGRVLVDEEPVSPFSMLVALRDGKVSESRAYLSDAGELGRVGRIPT